jgi:tetratricopeptide (TPR) repeat protein
MNTKPFELLFSSLIFLAACSTMKAGSDVAYGRQALLRRDNETALGYFQSALQADPNYKYGTAYQQGLLSYIGRAEYLTGRLPQARETLQKALAANKDEDIARVYLGLTVIRSGDREAGLEAGLKDVETGMRGIHEWLDWVNEAFRFSFGQYWDPAHEIRKAIDGDLAMITARDIDWQRLIADGEWVARRMEEEGDKARDDEQRDRQRDGSRNTMM